MAVKRDAFAAGRLPIVAIRTDLNGQFARRKSFLGITEFQSLADAPASLRPDHVLPRPFPPMRYRFSLFPPYPPVSQTRGYSRGRISYNAADYRSAGRKPGATAF